MKRAIALGLLALTTFGVARTVAAAPKQVTVANYYFEDTSTHDRTKIVVQQGGQVTFTVRQASYPAHTVDVDALDIHSSDLYVGQTFTTPVLDKPGNYYLYCRPHEARGHHTRLIVQAAPVKTPAPTRTSAPITTRTPVTASSAPAATTSPVASAAPSAAPTSNVAVASATPVPAGVGTAPPGSLGALPADPNSLEGLTGVRSSNGVPWTRALWWLLIATVPITAIAVFALRRNAQLVRTGAERAAAEAAAKTKTGTKRAPRKRKPPT